MSTFVLEKWHKGARCTIYSIRLDVDNDDALSEADKFFEKYGEIRNEDIGNAAKLLLQFIVADIGDVHGARLEFFNRFEREANALPYKSDKAINEILDLDNFYSGFPLRLYCYRVSEDVLVLYNGGIKTSQTAQNSDDISLKFYDAQKYTSKIREALIEGTILIKNSEIVFFKEIDEEIVL